MRTFTISEALLDELKDYLDNRQDVRDGSYGEPVANTEMFLLMRLEEECRPIASEPSTPRCDVCGQKKKDPCIVGNPSLCPRRTTEPSRDEWTISQNGATGRWSIYSNDFTHDAGLELTGDFDDAQAKAYAERICATLNASVAQSESVQTIAVAHPDKEPNLFLCCGDGEGTHEFKVCRGYEGVAAFYEAMCGRDADDTLDSLKRTWNDPDEWRNDGTALKLELYCARFYVWKVTAAEMAMPGAVASSATGAILPPLDVLKAAAQLAFAHDPDAKLLASYVASLCPTIPNGHDPLGNAMSNSTDRGIDHG